MTHRIVAISGGLERNSNASGLVRACVRANHPNCLVDVLDISSFPVFNFDLIAQNGKYPPGIEEAREKVRQADAVIFAVPELNMKASAAFINAYDWISFAYPMNGPVPPMNNKIGVIMSVGQNGGKAALDHISSQQVKYVKMKIFDKSITATPDQFDETGNVAAKQLSEQITQLLGSFSQFINANKA